jgi:hypothetical protein
VRILAYRLLALDHQGREELPPAVCDIRSICYRRKGALPYLTREILQSADYSKSCADLENFPTFCGTPIIRYRVHKSSQDHSTASILILSTQLCRGLPSGLFPSGCPFDILYAFLPHSCYMPCTSRPPRVDHPSYVCRRVQAERMPEDKHHFLTGSQGRAKWRLLWGGKSDASQAGRPSALRLEISCQ